MKSKISFVYLGASVFLILLSLFMGGKWLINTQVAFICSMIIIFASFLSYKGMIEKRLEDGAIPEEVDELDKIDDKFGLFREDEDIESKELSKEEFVKLYKEERKKSSGIKQTFSNLFKSGKGVFNNELFSAIPFLVGIGAVPISSLVLGLFLRD